MCLYYSLIAGLLREGGSSWTTEVDGALWRQKTFAYQGKCLKWINEQYQALLGEDRAIVDRILEGTGCELLLSEGT